MNIILWSIVVFVLFVCNIFNVKSGKVIIVNWVFNKFIDCFS